MFEPLQRVVLSVLKVPPEPHPPMGDPASLKVFRAGRNYFRLRIGTWAFAQVLALAGLLFWTAILIGVESTARTKKAAPPAQPPATSLPAEPEKSADASKSPVDASQRVDNLAKRFAENVQSVAKAAENAGRSAHNDGRFQGWAAYKQMVVEIGQLLPEDSFGLLWGLKIFGFALYLIQLPITYAVRRLDYEMRWYMVTDRSLRLRHGIWKVSESTMSFANIQQVAVNQGPLQRLLGLADVKVQSAGGGGGSEEHQQKGEDMHLGLFHSVTNAPEIRDLILERLRRFRETGLGDPEERMSPSTMAPAPAPADALTAARELVAEARALRAAVS